jgi:hypothetical protein
VEIHHDVERKKRYMRVEIDLEDIQIATPYFNM